MPTKFDEIIIMFNIFVCKLQDSLHMRYLFYLLTCLLRLVMKPIFFGFCSKYGKLKEIFRFGVFILKYHSFYTCLRKKNLGKNTL